MDFRITAVDRDRAVEHEGVTAIGNNEEKWAISLKSAVTRIERGLDRFFVEDILSGDHVYLGVYKPEMGEPQVRGVQGGRWTNHLLPLPSLRDCRMID